MSGTLRVVVESGPKGKKFAVYAPDWPGFTRGHKTEAGALDSFLSYIPRYQPIATLAGFESEFSSLSGHEIVDQVIGTGSTDFWGIPFGHSDFDNQEMTIEELDREVALMEAAWTYFDSVRARVSPELQKGPRGGGRDRDQIVRHVFGAEMDWERGIGLDTPAESMWTPEGLAEHRANYSNAIREYHAAGKRAGKTGRGWSLRFLIRHTAYHTLDHAWEMEDKDLTGKV